MTLLSFDLNAARLRAVRGPADEVPTIFPLEPPRNDLPLVLSLKGRFPEVGSPGVLLCQERPDLVYANFLPLLGQKATAPRQWRPRQQTLDAQQALKVVFERLRHVCPTRGPACCAVPPYLDVQQVRLVESAAEQARYPLAATTYSPLALGVAGHAETPWSGTVLLMDLDDHALWISLLREGEGQAELIDTYLYPELGLRAWRQRLLNALADCCILQSRRDPRSFPAAEQALFLQLDSVMEGCVQNRPANVVFQVNSWYQHLVLQPEDTEVFCAALLRPLLPDIQTLFDSHWPSKPPTAVLLSAQAANLPGLAVQIEELLDRWYHFHQPETAAAPVDEEDFGANLLQEEESIPYPRLVILPPEATARGVHLLTSHVQQGTLPPGHFDASLPLPTMQALDAGAPRLHFQGREYQLCDRNFTMGRRPDCDLVLDRHRFPNISPWHCEIVYDPRRYFLKDLSHEGTWLNDRPVTSLAMLRSGDRIRLGPQGPVIVYLGQSAANGMTSIA
jgi:hypothetical protein